VNEANDYSALPASPELDLDRLRDRLRRQAAHRRAAAGTRALEFRSEAAGFNWPQVQACLNNAERLAPVVPTVPTLGRLRWGTRMLVRLVLRVFLAMARVITVRQGDLNARLIEALRETAEGLRSLEKLVERQNERIRDLEALLWREEPRKTGS
jgi:hypothetical protein